LTYTVVQKIRDTGQVLEVATRVVFGTVAVVAAQGMSRVRIAFSTAFLEQQNGTDHQERCPATATGLTDHV
jgi:hypothetical protein